MTARCPDPRCGKPLATNEDIDAPGDDPTKCWMPHNRLAHEALPPWEEWVPKAIEAAVAEERERCASIAATWPCSGPYGDRGCDCLAIAAAIREGRA